MKLDNFSLGQVSGSMFAFAGISFCYSVVFGIILTVLSVLFLICVRTFENKERGLPPIKNKISMPKVKTLKEEK